MGNTNSQTQLSLNNFRNSFKRTPFGRNGCNRDNPNAWHLQRRPDTFLVRAVHNYSAQSPEDLKFSRGDFMEVENEYKNEDWMQAKHMRTGETGFIPTNYVKVEDGSPQNHDAWFDVKRTEAERKLLLMGNPKGTYILRGSAEPGHFALSIRYSVRGEWFVKHYRIKTLDNGGYFIVLKNKFGTIYELVNFYSEKKMLCCKLTKPYPRVYLPPDVITDLEITRRSVTKMKILGSGSFGEVFEGRLSGTLPVAIKQLKPGMTNQSRFLEEAKIMIKLQHHRIVQLLGVCTKDQPIYIITELMINGALLDYLRKPQIQAKLKTSDLLEMMYQISEGMAFLEEKNFIHRDLRAANILVSESGDCKVADFGLAHEDIYEAHEGTKYPIKWTAPEAAIGKIFSVKSDVWSFGILAYEIITFGAQPYPGLQPKEVLDEIQNGYRMQKPKPTVNNCLCPDELYDIMQQCWHKEPDCRPTFKHLQDTFYDWTCATEGQYCADGSNGN